MIVYIILLSLISAFLYRVGGASWGHKQVRRLGIPIISTSIMLFILKIQAPWYIHLISFSAMYGMLTTYWDFINGDDLYWLHGAGIALAYLLYAIFTGDWLVLILRVVILGVAMGLWCKFFANDWVEECGRGAFIILTLLLYLI